MKYQKNENQEFKSKREKKQIQEKRHSCDICDSKFTDNTTLKNHYESTHERIFYNCDKCDFNTTEKRTLTAHIQSIHNRIENENLPNIMDFILRMRSENDKKNNNKTNEELTKTNEEEDITSTQNMINDSRARRELKGKSNECDKCDYKTGSISLLRQHVKQCSKSSENMNKSDITETVENKKSKSKRIQCKKCEQKFNKQTTFKIHMESVHKVILPNQSQINVDQNQYSQNQENIKSRNQRINSKLTTRSQSKLTFHEEARKLRSYKKASSA